MRVSRYRGRHLRPRPKGTGPAVVGTATAVWLAGSSAASASTHQVRRGETLSSIASRYGTSTIALAHANHLSDPDLIVVGQRLRVPGGEGPAPAAIHTVRHGETLSVIASHYGTSVAALARINQLANPNLIVVGTKLKVGGGSAPAGASPGSAPTASVTARHRIRTGETLSDIASHYGTSVAVLARLNHISDPSLIIAGRTIRVPHAPAGGGAISSATVETLLVNSASRYGVEPSLVKAVAMQESGWQQDVRSSVGAIGVMQVMPGTARFINKVLGGGSLDVHRAEDNVALGVIYLRHMLSSMGTEKRALAGYFAGPGNVGKHLDKAQRHYVLSVLALKGRF